MDIQFQQSAFNDYQQWAIDTFSMVICPSKVSVTQKGAVKNNATAGKIQQRRIEKNSGIPRCHI